MNLNTEAIMYILFKNGTKTNTMKYLSIILVSLLLVSCGKEDEKEVDCREVQYSAVFSAAMDDEICFPDGNSFVIKNIEDMFCPCDAVCGWEGELSVLVETTNATGEKDLIRFGSASFSLEPALFENAEISSFTFDYELGTLPDCDNEYDSKNVTLNLTIVN